MLRASFLSSNWSFGQSADNEALLPKMAGFALIVTSGGVSV
jgi:hypothetical protein